MRCGTRPTACIALQQTIVLAIGEPPDFLAAPIAARSVGTGMSQAARASVLVTGLFQDPSGFFCW